MWYWTAGGLIMLGEDSRLGPTPELDHTIVALDRQQLENGQISIIAK